jgi:hypothetical protein
MKWQPIETAPRDGTRFIAHIANGMITVGFYIQSRHFAADSLGGGQGDTRPTHWMPLPEPPK